MEGGVSDKVATAVLDVNKILMIVEDPLHAEMFYFWKVVKIIGDLLTTDCVSESGRSREETGGPSLPLRRHVRKRERNRPAIALSSHRRVYLITYLLVLIECVVIAEASLGGSDVLEKCFLFVFFFKGGVFGCLLERKNIKVCSQRRGVDFPEVKKDFSAIFLHLVGVSSTYFFLSEFAKKKENCKIASSRREARIKGLFFILYYFQGFLKCSYEISSAGRSGVPRPVRLVLAERRTCCQTQACEKRLEGQCVSFSLKNRLCASCPVSCRHPAESHENESRFVFVLNNDPPSVPCAQRHLKMPRRASAHSCTL